MTAVCPHCGGRSDDSLLCTSCTDTLRTDLRGNAVHMGIAELVDNLHVAQAKLARGSDSGHAGPARERMALNLGAMDEVRNLEFYLGSWARDLTSDVWRPGDTRERYAAVQCADILLEHLGDIRRHGAVEELVDEITKAVHKARNFLDVEPFTRFPVGPCPEECDRTVFAVCPAEGSTRPALMACYLMAQTENRPDLAAGFAHSWTSVQFFRTGKRIREKMDTQQRQARINRAVYGEGAA
jgi:hypothetical protein